MRTRTALHNHTVEHSHGCAACQRGAWVTDFQASEVAAMNSLAYSALARDIESRTP